MSELRRSLFQKRGGKGSKRHRWFGAVVGGLPDGVLVDGSMPVLGGVDAIRAIVALGKARAPWWEPRLWLVTGDVTAEAEAEALRAGADGMLRKPVTGERLVSSLLGAVG